MLYIYHIMPSISSFAGLQLDKQNLTKILVKSNTNVNPVDGDIWYDFNNFQFRTNNVTTSLGAANVSSSSAGGTESLVLPKVGIDLPFKGLTAGTDITLTPGATDIVIDAPGVSTNATAILETNNFLSTWGEYSETVASNEIKYNASALYITTAGTSDAMAVTVAPGTYRASFNAQINITSGNCACTHELDLLLTDLLNNTYTTHAAAYASETLFAGYYRNAGATTHTGVLTLDAQTNPNAVFVFDSGGAHAVATGATIVLTNGAKSCNIFWMITGAPSYGTNANVHGNFISINGAFTTTGSVTLTGRFLGKNTTTTAITLTDLTATVPTDVSSLYPTPLLQDYLIYNSFGNISCTSYTNTGLTDWSIVTQSGTVSGFGSPWDGTYPSGGSTFIDLEYGIYNNNVLIPYSRFTRSNAVIENDVFISSACNLTVPAGPNVPITVKAKIGTNYGGVLFFNRTLFLLPLR
jgi:hypothetical protein